MTSRSMKSSSAQPLSRAGRAAVARRTLSSSPRTAGARPPRRALAQPAPARRRGGRGSPPGSPAARRPPSSRRGRRSGSARRGRCGRADGADDDRGDGVGDHTPAARSWDEARDAERDEAVEDRRAQRMAGREVGDVVEADSVDVEDRAHQLPAGRSPRARRSTSAPTPSGMPACRGRAAGRGRDGPWPGRTGRSTAKPRATNQPLPRALMPMISASTGGRLRLDPGLETAGSTFAISHSSGAVETVVRFSITSQNRAGSGMTASRNAAAGLGTAPPSRCCRRRR